MSILRNFRRPTAPRRLGSALLVAGISMATLFGVTGPVLASPTATGRASTTTSTCPSRSLCLYDGTNFTGEIFTVMSFSPSGSCVSLVDHGWGDRARSARNTHRNSAAMFMNDDCVGGPYQVPGNSSLPSFGTFTPESVWVPYFLS